MNKKSWFGKMPKNQHLAIVILSMLVLLVILVMLALMSIAVFFVALVAAVLGICLLKLKTDFFDGLGKDKNKGGTATGPLFPDQPKRETFSAHIILLYQGGMTTQQITVDREEFTIGRSPSCNFVLSGNTDISRNHATIRYEASRECSTITDNHSSHGTRVNGEYLTPGQPRTLHNGDLIQIEDRVMTVQNKNY